MDQLTPKRIHDAEHARRQWTAVVPEGTTIEDIKEPSYWAHVSNRVKQMDRIEIFCEDAAWWAEVLVVESLRAAAKVAVLNHLVLSKEEISVIEADPEYEVAYKGPVKKHCIIRLSDKVIVKEGIALKDDAIRELKGYLKALAA